MKTLIKKKATIAKNDNLILLCGYNDKLNKFNFSKSELYYIKKEQKKKKEIISINQYTRHVFIVTPKKQNDDHKHAESCRMLGCHLVEKIKTFKSILVVDIKNNLEKTREQVQNIL